ncbi:MAG: hypothetical protein Q8R60_06755 [Mycobacteriales bacterium]|nr:hypothetical protein [Mycobacteriales bacterium]
MNMRSQVSHVWNRLGSLLGVKVQPQLAVTVPPVTRALVINVAPS